MQDTTVPYAAPGVAAFEDLGNFDHGHLLTGNHPPLVEAVGMPLANNTTVARFTVVGRNAAGKIVPAVRGSADAADDIKPVGITAYAASLGASGEANVPVFYSGCFNPDALVWPASYTTEAQKLAAFEGAPTPTTIRIATRDA